MSFRRPDTRLTLEIRVACRVGRCERNNYPYPRTRAGTHSMLSSAVRSEAGLISWSQTCSMLGIHLDVSPPPCSLLTGDPGNFLMVTRQTLGISLLVVCLGSAYGRGQQPQNNPVPPSGTAVQGDAAQKPPANGPAGESEGAIRKREESQRMLGVVPTFGVTNRLNAPALTPRDKFHLMAKGYADPFIYFAVGAQAGLSQAFNNFEGYGQGAAGYGKRYGAAFADSADSNFFSNYFYPVLFKQDPRYFRLGEGSKKSRMIWALDREFIARKDSGGWTFHWSNVLGGLTAGGISNAYYPSEDRGFGLTMSRTAISFGYGAAGNLMLEFWPDISHKLFNKTKSQAHPTEPPGAPPK